MECAPGGVKVRVNSVHPGIIDTPMMAAGAADVSAPPARAPTASRERFAESHPMGRMGRDTDIANAIEFLASDAAAFMTGSELVVDGGMTAT